MILTSLGLGTTRLNPTIGRSGPVQGSPALLFVEDTEEFPVLLFVDGDEFPILLFLRED